MLEIEPAGQYFKKVGKAASSSIWEIFTGVCLLVACCLGPFIFIGAHIYVWVKGLRK